MAGEHIGDPRERSGEADVERSSGYSPPTKTAHVRPGEHAHELTDVRVPPIVVAGIGLGVVLGIALVVIQLLFNYFAVREGRHSPSTNPLAGAYGRQAPPEPRLQTAPLGDLATLRASEDARLHGYAWVDREAGVVRIPIERAIDLLAERGLPARADRNVPGARGDASAPSGGPR